MPIPSLSPNPTKPTHPTTILPTPNSDISRDPHDNRHSGEGRQGVVVQWVERTPTTAGAGATAALS